MQDEAYLVVVIPDVSSSESEEDEESHDDESTAVEHGEDAFVQTMERFKDDLFADEEEPQQG